ncbi:hypothetical protein E3E35_02775 [Thermococcus sp. GR7]|uniref:hypothetical protein n=1 Tax=unclassified Thermococcus TaxID=2627626 RepID=UPI0014320490|nr:hypothetical protein [Thermococcus sp. GR7]NJE77728.1 hypothetical protein [Thermococcus sp. GR4]NJF23768.1 hypothetical protein [Thermococcus sp. GR5]
MKLRGLPLIILMIPVFLPAVSAQSPLAIIPLNDEFSGVPGDIIIIPFKLMNLGNQTLSNVTVYVTGPTDGFLYQSKVIRDPIEPNETIQDTLSVKILNVDPGKYTLTLVARAGSSYSEAQITVSVKTFVDYALRIDVGDEYTYGSNITAALRITSRANGVIIGRIGYTLSRDGDVLETFSTTIYLKPGESWIKNITLITPKVGNYMIYFWANFSGRFKSTTATFRVYQRNLRYDAYFRDGAIYVHVYDEDEKGVSDISVRINGVPFKTDDDGTVSYLVDQPGTYEIVLNLDGKIVTTFVEVKKLFLSYFQKNGTLLVKVVDSTGEPVPNITVTASGPLGKDYAVTNSSGIAVVDLEKTGYGTIMLKAESSRYVGAEASAKVVPPVTPTPTPTTTTSSPSNTTTTPVQPPKNYGPLAAILLIAGVLLAGTSYAAFFMPIIQEERLDRYYFVKVKAPRLRSIDNFRFEKGVTALGARATKGSAKVEDNRVVWEIEHLEPGEEAYLQVILG